MDRALGDHELVKVRARVGDRDERDRLLANSRPRPVRSWCSRSVTWSLLRRHPERPRLLLPDWTDGDERPPGRAVRSSDVTHRDDLEGARAAGTATSTTFAFRTSHERPGIGEVIEIRPRRHVGLELAHDLEHDLRPVVLVSRSTVAPTRPCWWRAGAPRR